MLLEWRDVIVGNVARWLGHKDPTVQCYSANLNNVAHDIAQLSFYLESKSIMSGNARSLGLFNPYIVLLSHTLPTVYCKCIVLYSNSFRVPKKCQSSLILHSVGVRPDPGASGCRWGSIQTKHLPRELNQIVD